MYQIFQDVKALIEIVDRFKHGNKKTGIQAFHDKRSALSKEWWENFYTKRKKPKDIIIMGQSLAKAFSNSVQAEAFTNWCSNGAKMRILLLSPDAPEVTQIRSVGKGISYGNFDDPNLVLRKKILDTIDVLYENVIFKIKDLSLRPMLRVAIRDMPFSLVSIDDDMVITLYGLNPEADEQPTLIIKGRNTKSFLSFVREFENLWFSYSKIALFEDPILKEYRKDWKTYIDLYNFDLKPGPPRQAIIFPTYTCQQNCSYCMYKPARIRADSEEKNKELDIQTIEKIISDLISFGVNRIELSGGGEPSEHSSFDKILQIIESVRAKNDEIKFGLLTNGLRIDRFDPKRMLYAFNDYIRISRCQEVNFDSQQPDKVTFVKWKNNIKSLLNQKRTNLSNNTKIGIKYLLTNSNFNDFTKFISDDLKDSELCEVDHFRFRSTRNIDSANLAKIEQEVFYIIEKAKLATNHPERISLSLGKVSYQKNFKCWISPMNVVIDPAGDVFICCNYLYDRNSKCIGNIHTDTIDSIWHSQKHKEIRSNIRRENCDRDKYCNCRYAELQSQLESLTAFL